MSDRELAREALRLFRAHAEYKNRKDALRKAGWKYLGEGISCEAFRKGGVVAKFVHPSGRNRNYDYWVSSRKALQRLKQVLPKRVVKEYYSGEDWAIQRFELLARKWDDKLERRRLQIIRAGVGDVAICNMGKSGRVFDALIL